MRLELPDTPAWMSDAICASTDPTIFYPEHGGSAREAKTVCATCPVINDCLQLALDNNDDHGIFGGLTGHERRAIARTRTAA